MRRLYRCVSASAPGSHDADAEKVSFSTRRLRESAKKSDEKGCFSGRCDPKRTRSDAKNCDFRGVLITTQYTGCVDHAVDSVVLGRKHALKNRAFWGGRGGFELVFPARFGFQFPTSSRWLLAAQSCFGMHSL